MISPMMQANDRPENDETDGVLRDFFRSEMPKAWPPATAVLKRSMQPTILSRNAPLRTYGRLALAASIVLMLLGYLTLASGFSRHDSNAVGTQGTIIGKKEIRHDVTRGGRPVEVIENTAPSASGDGPATIINVRELPQTPNKRR